MEDLACRWTTADLARTQSPTDLKFKDGENGFDQQGSNLTAMRIYQAVLQAKHMFQSGLTSGAVAPGSVGVSRSNLDALCDRIAMEKDWISQTGTPKPRLEYQGSDAFLKKQFKYCAKERLGTLHPSISSQLFRKKESAPRRATGGSRLMALKRRKKKRKGRILRPGGSWSGCTRFSGTTF